MILQTYLWDSVCSAGVSFCFLEVILICKKTPGRPHFDKTQKEDNDGSNA